MPERALCLRAYEFCKHRQPQFMKSPCRRSLTRSHFAKVLVFVAILVPIVKSAQAALPTGWSDADIGSPGSAGSASYNNGLWTVAGGGSDIWNNADQFNYASTPLYSDGTLDAR